MDCVQLETVKPEPDLDIMRELNKFGMHQIVPNQSAISDAFMGKTDRFVAIAVGLRQQDGSQKLTLRDAVYMNSAIIVDHGVDLSVISFPYFVEITKFSVYAGDLEKWMVVQTMNSSRKHKDILLLADQLFGPATMYRVTKRTFQETDGHVNNKCLITQLDPTVKRAEISVRISRIDERTYTKQSRTNAGQTEPGIFIAFTCQDASGIMRAVIFDEHVTRLRQFVQDGKVIKIINPVIRVPKDSRYTVGYTTDYQLMFDQNTLVVNSTETIKEPINVDF